MEMNNKIKELVDKIQQEGLEKANREAEEIIKDAREEAALIVENAKKEATKIRNEAKKSADDFKEKMKSEVRMSQQQALVKLKKEITELVMTHVIKEPLNDSMEDNNFMNSLMETMVKNWKNGSSGTDLQLLLPEDQLESAESHFRKKASDLLNQGLVIKDYPGLSKGFELQPNNGHYKISMSDEAFESFIKEHFKPITVEFLFGGNKE